MAKEKSKTQYIFTELLHHLPFSIFGVCLGIVFMGVLTFIATLAQANTGLFASASGELFHVFHTSHVLLSAVATTAMFWKHDDRNIFKACLIGFLGSLMICGISDIFFPYIGGLILGHEMNIHICLIKNPGTIFPFAIVGVLAGLAVTANFEKSTEYSHSAHVFVSSVASILYLISFGLGDWIHSIGGVFLITIFAVMIPCCASDIVFPLTCTHRDCKHT
ncbi:hypothetical protein MNBD_UNCLBAC01-340 [hydrothermal vent metagenome]|uniref:Uncharacterized protein n=1 Tax=hydrothermal vent metagenome TaxID=652676 RepID=A0A3B1CYT8_9ZZZZ